MTEYKGSNADGDRARRLEKERLNKAKIAEEERQKISNETERKVRNMGNKFASQSDNREEILKQQTIGLVTYDEFKEKQKSVLLLGEGLEEPKPEKKKKEKKQPKTKRKVLSFGDEEDDVGVAPAANKKVKLVKNPTVETGFLPDRDREEEEKKERERLKREWLEEQEKAKKERIIVTYSYWDGTGHRKQIELEKGARIDQFLARVREEFKELRGTSVENLIYVKEDLIIPHNYTFYDLIVTKARGKSGPLFSFDVHDDIRLVADASVEKDESHAGKVLERSWYERNKHIFPASRWEVYDPNKKWEKYTIHDTLEKH